mgnify:CR=1 FL=1
MARYGSGDDENYYSDDDATQLSNYGQGGYPDDYHAGYDQPTPWYRKPAALVAFGALGAVIIALPFSLLLVVGVGLVLIAMGSGLLSLGVLKKSQPADLLR